MNSRGRLFHIFQRAANVLFVTLICLLVLYTSGADLPALPAWFTAGGVLGVHAVVWGLFLGGSEVMIRRAARGAAPPGRSWWVKAAYGLVMASVAADVFIFGWPEYVRRATAGVRGVPLLDDLLLVLPLVLTQTVWALAQYRFERRCRGMTLSAVQYVVFRFRVEQGIVLAPWLAISAASDLAGLAFAGTRWADTADSVLGVLLLAGLVVFGPVLLTRVWRTARLPDGPLRTALDRFCGAHRFRCREFLVWHTHGRLGNAAVAGLFPRFRYVVLSDALLDVCLPGEAMAVVAHEIGHVRLHHLRFYLFFAAGYMAFYVNLQDWAAGLLPDWFRSVGALDFARATSAETLLFLVYSLAYWGVLFGYISRRLELEADLYSTVAMEGPDLLVQALAKLSWISGMPDDRDTWRHFSISRRAQFLASHADPESRRRFVAGLRMLRAGFMVVLLAALGRLAAVHGGLLLGGGPALR